MWRWRQIVLKLWNFARRGRAEQELSREISSHLTLIEDEFRRRGMNPEEARLAARRAFGGIDQAKELHRAERSFLWLDQTVQDLRYAIQTLGRSPGFTLVAVLTLALGIGANSAIFSVVNAVLLEPLPYRNPDRLVRIVENVPAAESRNGQPARIVNMTADDAVALRSRTRTLSHIAMYSERSVTLTGRGEALVIRSAQVWPSTFSMLGQPPVIGRVFGPEEEKPGSDDVVILSYAAWQRHFGGDPGALGQRIELAGTVNLGPGNAAARRYSVIGVMPQGFAFPSADIQCWTPFTVTPSRPGQVLRLGITMARLKDDVSFEAAQAEINTIFRGLRGLPETVPQITSGPPRMEVVGVKEEQARPYRPALLVLSVAVGFVLLIACSNVANLLLARTIARQREIAIRASLGAGRSRLIRHVLTESVLLGVLGGAGGIFLAFGGVQLLLAEWPGNVPIPGRVFLRPEGIAIDAAVVAFTASVSILAGILLGLAPTSQVFSTNPTEATKDGAARGSRLIPRNGANALVVAEIGLSMMLLVGAGLLIHSFLKLWNVNPGFDRSNVLTFNLVLPSGGAERAALTDRLIARLKSLPGIQSVGYSVWSPLEPGSSSGPRFEIPRFPDGTLPGIQLRFLPVSRDYLSTIGVPLVAGRWFDDNDGSGQPRVMLINRELARHFPAQNPIGQFVNSGTPAAPVEVIGIVENVRQGGLDTEPDPQYFLDFRQYSAGIGPFSGGGFIAVRTDGDPASAVPNIRGVVAQLDARAAIDNAATLEQLVSNSVAVPRFYAVVLGIFAALAVILAAIGIYGLIAYSVVQRTREIGIRVAMGARRGAVLSLVLRRGFVLAVTGVLLGLGGAITLTRYLESMLFGLTPLDPLTFAVVSAIFLFIAVLASYIPARRATKVDPLVALRHE